MDAETLIEGDRIELPGDPPDYQTLPIFPPGEVEQVEVTASLALLRYSHSELFEFALARFSRAEELLRTERDSGTLRGSGWTLSSYPRGLAPLESMMKRSSGVRSLAHAPVASRISTER